MRNIKITGLATEASLKLVFKLIYLQILELFLNFFGEHPYPLLSDSFPERARVIPIIL